jgi:hypothetical protein
MIKKLHNLGKRKSGAFCPVMFLTRLLGKLAVLLLIAFVSTFTIYFLNLENKLIYHVVTPFLNSHYDKQVRDRRI